MWLSSKNIRCNQIKYFLFMMYFNKKICIYIDSKGSIRFERNMLLDIHNVDEMLNDANARISFPKYLSICYVDLFCHQKFISHKQFFCISVHYLKKITTSFELGLIGFFIRRICECSHCFFDVFAIEIKSLLIVL